LGSCLTLLNIDMSANFNQFWEKEEEERIEEERREGRGGEEREGRGRRIGRRGKERDGQGRTMKDREGQGGQGSMEGQGSTGKRG
jgi:hypothetical protein